MQRKLPLRLEFSSQEPQVTQAARGHGDSGETFLGAKIITLQLFSGALLSDSHVIRFVVNKQYSHPCLSLYLFIGACGLQQLKLVFFFS